MGRYFFAAWVVVAGSLLAGCSCGDDEGSTGDSGSDGDTDTDSDSDTDTGSDSDVDTDTGTGTGTDTDTSSSTDTEPDCEEIVPGCCLALCSDRTWACGNCLDDDEDGLLDSDDPDCLGACDNTEDGYAIGIPGANHDCQQDCYWDDDSGDGNDHCTWDHACDSFEDGDPPYPEERCTYNPDAIGGPQCPDVQSEDCHDICDPMTPNGCDCFGCCETEPGSGRWVYLGSLDYDTEVPTPSCFGDVLDDDARCHPCTPVEDCTNDCGECELCFGRLELPPGCDPDEGGDRCPDDDGDGDPNERPCGLEGDPLCPDKYVCITGCCTPFFG